MTTIWKERGARLWREWGQPLLVVLLVMGSLRSAVADWNDVPTGSMRPTILEGDRIFVDKLAWDLKIPFTRTRLARWAQPARGEIVVFYSPADGRRLVKRVVAVAGDVVEMRHQRLTLNGEAVSWNEPRQADGESAFFFTETLGDANHTIRVDGSGSRQGFSAVSVPENSVMVLGDNRDNSADSRWFGFVPIQDIVGEATHVALSVDPERHYRPRWERFFSRLN